MLKTDCQETGPGSAEGGPELRRHQPRPGEGLPAGPFLYQGRPG